MSNFILKVSLVQVVLIAIPFTADVEGGLVAHTPPKSRITKQNIDVIVVVVVAYGLVLQGGKSK